MESFPQVLQANETLHSETESITIEKCTKNQKDFDMFKIID